MVSRYFLCLFRSEFAVCGTLSIPYTLSMNFNASSSICPVSCIIMGMNFRPGFNLTALSYLECLVLFAAAVAVLGPVPLVGV